MHSSKFFCKFKKFFPGNEFGLFSVHYKKATVREEKNMEATEETAQQHNEEPPKSIKRPHDNTGDEPESKESKSEYDESTDNETTEMSQDAADNDTSNPESLIWIKTYAHTEKWINLPIQYFTKEVCEKCIEIKKDGYYVAERSVLSSILSFSSTKFFEIARKNGWKVVLEKFKPQSQDFMLVTPPLFCDEGYNPIEKVSESDGKIQVLNSIGLNFGIYYSEPSITIQTKINLLNIGDRLKQLARMYIGNWTKTKEAGAKDPKAVSLGDCSGLVDSLKYPVSQESNSGYFKLQEIKPTKEDPDAGGPKSAEINILRYKRKGKVNPDDRDEPETEPFTANINGQKVVIQKTVYEPAVRSLKEYNGCSYDIKKEVDAKVLVQKKALGLRVVDPEMVEKIRQNIKPQEIIVPPKTFWAVRLEFYRIIWTGNGLSTTVYVRQMNENYLGHELLSSKQEVAEC
jgi:hypothetical protein